MPHLSNDPGSLQNFKPWIGCCCTNSNCNSPIPRRLLTTELHSQQAIKALTHLTTNHPSLKETHHPSPRNTTSSSHVNTTTTILNHPKLSLQSPVLTGLWPPNSNPHNVEHKLPSSLIITSIPQQALPTLHNPSATIHLRPVPTLDNPHLLHRTTLTA